MSRLSFFWEVIKNFRKVGTITQSGKVLSNKVASFIESDRRVTIVEIGAGDGAITKAILNRISSDSKLYSIELNENLFKKLVEIKDDRFTPINGNAENLEEILSKYGISEIDHLVSALPFIVFPEKIAEKILVKSKKFIKKDGYYLQIHYAKTITSLYESVFGNLKSYFVLNNVPPAYVFVCQK